MFVHDLGQGLLAFNFFSVDGDDEIATDHDRSIAEVGAFGTAAQSGTIGRTSFDSLNNEQAVIGG